MVQLCKTTVLSVLSDKATKKERNEAAAKALRAFPQRVKPRYVQN